MPRTARFKHPKVVIREALHRLQSTPASRRYRVVFLLLVAVSSVTQSSVLEEVIVSGTVDPRVSELVTSQGTRSVTRQEQISLALSPADLMVAIPGVAASGQGGLFQSYSLRGFGRSRIRTEVSGVPIITDRRAGNSLSFLPPTFIDTIRADMGPASSLYGSGAMGGVMSVSLDTPARTSLEVSRSSMGGASSAVIKAPISETRSVMASFRKSDRGHSSTALPLNTQFEQSSLYLREQGAVGGAFVSGEFLASRGSNIGKSNTYFPDERVSGYPEDRHELINLRIGLPSRALLQGYLHQQAWTASTDRLEDRKNTTHYESLTYGGLWSAIRTSDAHDDRYGVEHTGRRGVNIAQTEVAIGASSISSDLVSDGAEHVTGLFAERTWHFENVTPQVGIRVDSARATNSGNTRSHKDLNVQARVNWRLTQDWSLDWEVGSAYRLPTLSELYFSGKTPRGEVRGNPNLAPEKTVGLQTTLLREGITTTFEVTAFSTRIEDYIERFEMTDELRAYRNIGSGELWGLDGQLVWRNRAFTQRLSWQWQKGTSASGATLADLAPPSLRYNGTWESSRYSLGLDVRYQASQDTVGPGENPLNSVLIVSASALWKFSEKWHSEISVTNGLDRGYRVSADDDAPLSVGRAVTVTLLWQP
ncbi:MAG: TonB-dependent receptor [Luminiphilus sp.]|nr:TonB-dependent receptor [Luminiphilus sp.]